MIRESNIKKLLALVFVLTLFWGFIKCGSYNEIQKITEYLKQDVEKLDADDALTIDSLETEFTAGMWNQKELIDLNGAMAKRLNMQGFYSDMGMYVTDENVIVSASVYTTTDYEYEQTVSFYHFLSENGINLLYVNEPTKYIDDNLFREQFGVETYSNRNMDNFLAGIRAAGVPTIDLRDNIYEEGLSISDLFYRTDHHWTTNAGLWAAQIIAGGLNEYCGYDIDTFIYDESNYVMTEWKNCWLGEQGRLVAQTYVGLDDFTEIKPDFPTNYTFTTPYGTFDGTFDNFVNESVYNLENDVYENLSWHYSYGQIDCINNDVEYGKVLILGDSYDQVMIPFLSLGVRETDFLVLRDKDASFNLKNHILENGYDTVIICYAQFMLGAHDDPTSANYRMYTFE